MGVPLICDRRGIVVAEALVSLLLGLALVGLGWRILSRQRLVAVRLIHEMDVLSARRVAAMVMGRDLRRGVAGRDWPDPVGDSLPLRVFRGWGLSCASVAARPGTIVVAYRGERSPSPVKDSVLVLTDGRWLPADLIDRARIREPSCSDGLDFDMEVWTVDPPISGPLLRVFEHGSYHVQGGALRYRRGRGGRQPLTPEVFTGSSTMEGSRDRVLLRLVSDRAPWGGGTWSTSIPLWSREVTPPGREE